MNCREVNAILDRLLDDALTPREAVALRRHMDVCPDCCDSLRTYKDVVTMARRVAQAEETGSPPPSLIDSILLRRPAG